MKGCTDPRVIRNKRELEGKKFTTNQGYEITVVEYRGATDIDIAFHYPQHCVKTVEMCAIKRGNIANPYHRNCLGGHIGEGELLSKSKFYPCWTRMLRRCIKPISRTDVLAYGSVSICEDWMCFANFNEWANTQCYSDGWELDKDLFSGGGSKSYSPDNCCFLPSRINKALCYALTAEGCYEQHGKWYATMNTSDKANHYLGLFSTRPEARKAYNMAKADEVERIVSEHGGGLDNRVRGKLKDFIESVRNKPTYDIEDFEKDIELFNIRCGNINLAPEDPLNKVCSVLKSQALLILEEVEETVRACENKDEQEMVDGVQDILVTSLRLLSLLGKRYDLMKAAELVMENNHLKYTDDVKLLEQWVVASPPDIYGESSESGGKKYYYLKDLNGKIRKWPGFPKVELNVEELRK